MARIKKKWQSGAADMVSVAVGLVILSIAASGTAMSMLYGRDVLARQERYKSAAYMLKREMEKVTWELKSFTQARLPGAFNGRRQYRTQLQAPTEFGTGNQAVDIVFTMEPVTAVRDLVYQDKIAYWIVTMHANWNEPDMAGGASARGLQQREISFTTAVDNGNSF